LWANATELVSVGIGGSNPDGNSSLPSLSTDGRYVAFQSSASNLVVGDSNGKIDVFVRDMASQSVVRANVDSAGGQLANSARLSFGQTISGDGRYVNFQTTAHATPADLNTWQDVYVRDLVSNSTILVSVTPGGAAGDFFSYAMSIAADGTVLFESDADDLAAGSSSNLYVYTPGATPAVAPLWNGAVPFYADYAGTVSAYANVAFFNSSFVLPGDTSIPQDYSLPVGVQSPLISAISTSPLSYTAPFADNDSYELNLPGPSISADGRFVAFTSYASNLVDGDTNGVSDVFVRDRLTQITTRVSTTSTHAQSTNASYSPSITPDGRYISFTSESDLAVPDSNGAPDVYRYDRLSYELTAASVNAAGQIGNSVSNSPHISDDGNVIVFASSATNLVAGELVPRSYIFARDIAANVTQRVSAGVGGAEANGASGDPLVSGDGNVVCFSSAATNLVSGISGQHLYAYDRTASTTEQVDVGPTGEQPDYTPSSCGGLSHDGRYIVLVSPASTLDPASGATGYNSRIYVRDRQNNSTTLVSKNSLGVELNNGSFQPHISGDGRYVTFVSPANNYDPLAPDFSYNYRVFVYDTASAVLFQVSTAADGIPADDLSFSPHLSRSGKRIVFTSYADNLTPLDGNGHIEDVFVAEQYLDVIFASGFETCYPNIGCP